MPCQRSLRGREVVVPRLSTQPSNAKHKTQATCDIATHRIPNIITNDDIRTLSDSFSRISPLGDSPGTNDIGRRRCRTSAIRFHIPAHRDPNVPPAAYRAAFVRNQSMERHLRRHVASMPRGTQGGIQGMTTRWRTNFFIFPLDGTTPSTLSVSTIGGRWHRKSRRHGTKRKLVDLKHSRAHRKPREEGCGDDTCHVIRSATLHCGSDTVRDSTLD